MTFLNVSILKSPICVQAEPATLPTRKCKAGSGGSRIGGEAIPFVVLIAAAANKIIWL
jgi:hypothetical protein